MAKWPMVGYDGAQQLNGVNNRYAAFGGDLQTVTEVQIQQEVRDTYTASNLRLYLSSWVGGAGVDDMIATFRVNGGAGNQTITINATGEHEDTTNTDSLSSGNLINAHFDHSAGGHADEYTVETYQVTLDASTDVPPIMHSSIWGFLGAETEFASLQGSLDEQATETDVEYTVRATRTLIDFRVYVLSHTTQGAVTVRKNQTDPASGLTVSPSGTGETLDTTNNVSYVAGDEANYGTDGTAALQLAILSVEADTSSGVQAFGGVALLGTGDLYLAPSADVSTGTEAEVQIEAEAAATIQNLFTNCTTFVDNNTVISRKNAGDGTLTVTVTGTGITEDTSNSDTLAAEDDLSIERSTGASTGTAIWAAVEWETDVTPAVNKNQFWRRSGGVPGLFGRQGPNIGRTW